MFKNFTLTVILLSQFFAVNAIAKEDSSEKDALTPAIKAQLTEKLATKIGLKVKTIKASPIPSFVELYTEQGLFYASVDGNYLMQGSIYGIGGKEVVNHTEDSMALMRIEGIKQFKDDMIVYPAKDEKHVITVFTDITCGYCRKMHKQMDEFNDKGITVRYLAYPRSGIFDRAGKLSDGFKDLRSIWCHEDPSVAMTKAKLGSSVAERICESPVEAEFNFGRQIGVNSTPAIIFPNGMLAPGYRAPEALLKILESMAAES